MYVVCFACFMHYTRRASAGEIRALESVHLWAGSMQVYRTVSAGFRSWETKTRLEERLETGWYMHSDLQRVSLSLCIQFCRHLENALRSDPWTCSSFKENIQFTPGNRVDSFLQTDMNTNDAKEYLSKREIPQLFEVRTFALMNPIERMCFLLRAITKFLTQRIITRYIIL